MFAWLAANAGTIAAALVLLGIVAAAVAGMRRERKQGKCSCGMHCENCPGNCSGCH